MINNHNVDPKSVARTVLHDSLVKCKNVFAGVFLCGMAINVMMMFVPIYTMQVLDRVLTGGSLSTLTMLSIITVAALMAMISLEACRNFIMSRVGDWLDRRMAPILLRKAISVNLVNSNVTGGDMMRDLSAVKGFVTGYGIFSVFDAPWSVLYLILIFYISPFTGVLCIL